MKINIKKFCEGAHVTGLLKRVAATFLLIQFSLVSTGTLAEVVNINKADADALQKNLQGIGPVKAKSIVDYRRKHGSFKTIGDLKAVPGIGKDLLKKNKKNLSTSRGLTRAKEAVGKNHQQALKSLSLKQQKLAMI